MCAIKFNPAFKPLLNSYKSSKLGVTAEQKALAVQISSNNSFIIILQSYEMNTVVGLLLMALAMVNSAIVINGCLRTTMLASGQMKCIECNFYMGVTQDGKCAYCKPGESVVNGVCIAIKPVVTTPTIVIMPTPQSNPLDTSSIPVTASQNSSNPSKNMVQFTVINQNSQTSSQKPNPALMQEQSFPSRGSDSTTPTEQQQAFAPTPVQTSNNVDSFGSFGSSFGVMQQDFFSSDSAPSLPFPTVSPITSQPISNAQNSVAPASPAANPQAQSSESLASSFSIAPSQQFKDPSPPKTSPASSSSEKEVPTVSPYPQYPYCFDYDGTNCWACLKGYLLNLVLNQCVPYVKPAAVTLAPPADPAGIKSSTPDNNCNVYSEQDKLCKQCFRNYYLNKSAKQCTPVDALCRSYDENDGSCLTCYSKYSLQGTKCVANDA